MESPLRYFHGDETVSPIRRRRRHITLHRPDATHRRTGRARAGSGGGRGGGARSDTAATAYLYQCCLRLVGRRARAVAGALIQIERARALVQLLRKEYESQSCQVGPAALDRGENCTDDKMIVESLNAAPTSTRPTPLNLPAGAAGLISRSSTAPAARGTP